MFVIEHVHVTKANSSKVKISSIDALSTTKSQLCKNTIVTFRAKKPNQYLMVLAKSNLSHFKYITKIGTEPNCLYYTISNYY